MRILWPKIVAYQKPRGLRFGPHGRLYCAAQDEVIVFNFETGECLGSPDSAPTLKWPGSDVFPLAEESRQCLPGRFHKVATPASTPGYTVTVTLSRDYASSSISWRATRRSVVSNPSLKRS